MKTSGKLEIIKDWAIAVLSGLLLVSVLVVGYLAFLDGTVVNPVISYKTSVLTTDEAIYSPGDLVMAKVQFFKSRNIVGTMKWNLVNHRVFAYAAKEISLPIGVYDLWNPIERLPTTCAAGEYHFEGIVSYRVNPLRVVTYKLQTEPFRIMPPANQKETE